MRIFTLGKNGIPLFFFALILFSGTFSSYGQETCPTVDDTDATQYFCDAGEAEIGDLVVTSGTDVVWYASQTSTDPLAETRFLVDGTTYYAGTADLSCVGNRAEVTVSIASQPIILGLESSFNPNPSTKQSVGGVTIIGVCVADVENPGVTVGDFRTNLEDETQVRWYTTRTGGSPLDPTTQLQNNTDYYASRVSELGQCETNRSRVTVRLYSEEAPTGDAVQTFCAAEEPTLADIVASGENNYYRTETSQTELSPNTPLVDGRTYYLSTLGENCESFERLAVTVEVQDPAIQETVSAQVCVSDIEENPTAADFEQYFMALLGNPTGGSLEPSPEELLAQYQQNPIGVFTANYITEGNCEAMQASVEVIDLEQANAGTIDNITLDCTATDVVVLDDSILSADATRGGSFTAAEGVLDENQNFDPAVGPGTYTITYTVDETLDCVEGEDVTTFTITVESSAYAGEDQYLTFCDSEIQAIMADFSSAQNFFQDILENQEGEVDTTGEFDASPAEVFEYYNARDFSEPFTTWYRVGEGECSDEAFISITIIEDQEANAGEIENITVDCGTSEVVILDENLLSDDATRGGTFTAAEGLLNEEGNFDPAVGAGEYTITYTVDESINCVEGEDSTTFTITVNDGSTDADDLFVQLCSDEIDPNPTVQDIRTYITNQVRLLTDYPDTGTFDPTPAELAAQYADASGLGTFTTTYTVDTECGEVSFDIAIQVNETQAANAGEIADINVACGVSDVVVLNETLLSGDATTGGTFTAAEGILDANGNFDPAVGAGEYVITYSVDDSIACVEGEDSTTFTITVIDGTTDADDLFVQLCSDEIDPNANTQDIRTYFLNQVRLLTDYPDTGTFDPTPAELAAQYADANGLGTFTTTYTVETECGEVSFDIAIQVNETQTANAGEIADISVACGVSEVVVLDETLLSEDATRGGTFTAAEGVLDANGNFDPAIGAGEYAITYTVDDSINCVEGEDSTTFTVTVNEGNVAANDVFVQLCSDEIDNPTVNGFRSYLRNQIDLQTDLPLTGTFNPTAAELLAQFEAANGLGLFTTNYTVDTACGPVTIEVAVQIDQTQTANAGEIADISVACESNDVVILDEALLSEDATRGGTFTAAEGILDANGNFDPAIGAGEYTITYSVDDSINCVEGEDSTTFTITVGEGSVTAEDIAVTLCEDEITNPTVSGFRNFFNALVSQNSDLPTGGTFSPTMEELVAQYQANSTGTFVTNYTATTECGELTIEITVNVLEREAANAGEINDVVITCTTDGVFVLDGSILSEDATQGGTFTANAGVLVNGNFDPSIGVGVYTITYTVDESIACVEGEDSTTFTIEVLQEGPNAGADNSTSICLTDVPRASQVRQLYLSLLEPGVPQDGTFSPTIQELIDRYNNVSNFGTFTTTYTVSNGECEDSAELSVTVGEPTDANAGEDVSLTFCTTEGVQNLYDFLSADATGGTFEGYEDGIFDPSTAELGVTTINYVIDEEENPCAIGNDTAVFTITVTAPEDANAGDDVAVEFCIAQDEDIQLTSLLSAGAQTTGSFSAPYENGVFNPSAEGLGEYTITYTVDDTEACVTGTDTATITINVTDAPEAPVAEDLTFCAADNATVADLDATGENIRWYTDAELQTPANDEDLVVEGTYYATQTTAGGCESEAVAVNVTVANTAAPTLETDGNTFCASDRPTIASLSENIVETGTVTWYDAETGGVAYSSSDLLQDNTTYYAALTDATSACEGTNRLAVTVNLEICELLIPEAFSPNGDTMNDTFTVEYLADQYPNYTMEIFNRWGNTVYRGNASTPDWDGTSTESRTLGDNVLPAGVYFYILNYNDGQTAPTQGRVYLSR